MLLGELIKNIKPAYKSIKFNNIRFNSKDCKTNDIFFSIQGNKLKGNDYMNQEYLIETISKNRFKLNFLCAYDLTRLSCGERGEGRQGREACHDRHYSIA